RQKNGRRYLRRCSSPARARTTSPTSSSSGRRTTSCAVRTTRTPTNRQSWWRSTWSNSGLRAARSRPARLRRYWKTIRAASTDYKRTWRTTCRRAEMQFGLFSESGYRLQPVSADSYEEDLAEIVLGDQLGFCEAWIAAPNTVRPNTITDAHLLIRKLAGLSH